MASTLIELILERDEISLDDLVAVAAAFSGYLKELDRGQGVEGRRTLDFRLVTLSYSSPVHIGAVAEARENVADSGPVVASKAIRGIHEIEAGGGRPTGFPDEALEHLRVLAGYSVNGTAAVTIKAPALNLAAPVTSALATAVERVLSQGDSIGAIEGQLDTISVHGRPYFTLYDAVSGRGVRCYFKDDRRPLVLRSLGKRMLAHGRLRRDPSGLPKELHDLDALEPLGEPEGSILGLPGIFRGIDAHERLRNSVASNPERIYWDSCTYIDHLEGGHALAAEMEMIMEDWRKGLVMLVTSALTIAEVLFVRCADVKRRADRSREKDIEAMFNPPPGPRFLLVELSRTTSLKARDLVWNAGIDPKDAVHVASALEAHCEVLFTTEGALRTKTGLVGGTPTLRIEAPSWTKQLVAQEEIPPSKFTELTGGGPSEP